MHDEIKAVLNRFEPITLREMEGVMLMDRTDTKFVFPAGQFVEVLQELRPHYRALVVAGTALTRYETLYYDTADLELYHEHHNERANRFKVRSRLYVESDLRFFEIKYRNNKGRTIKNRIRIPAIEPQITPEPARLLGELTDLDPARLAGTLWVHYWRATLVSKTTTERVTLDVGLHFTKDGRQVDFREIAIAEVKRAKLNSPSPIVSVLRRHSIRPDAMSKYCLGILHTHAPRQRGNFKQGVRMLRKIAADG
jgi:hypothetical protein